MPSSDIGGSGEDRAMAVSESMYFLTSLSISLNSSAVERPESIIRWRRDVIGSLACLTFLTSSRVR